MTTCTTFVRTSVPANTAGNAGTGQVTGMPDIGGNAFTVYFKNRGPQAIAMDNPSSTPQFLLLPGESVTFQCSSLGSFYVADQASGDGAVVDVFYTYST
jgi:hypothetical protein